MFLLAPAPKQLSIVALVIVILLLLLNIFFSCSAANSFAALIKARAQHFKVKGL